MNNKKIIALLAGLIIFSLVISGCGSNNQETIANSDSKKAESVEQKASKEDNNKLVVQTAEVTKDGLKIDLNFTGELIAYREVNLVSETSGVVRELNFEESDKVRKGESLLKLDQAIQKANVEKAEGNLEVAKARLEELEAGARLEEIKQAEASLEQAEAELNNARKNFKRFKNLYEKRVVSKSKYDSAKSKYEVTKARLESARQKLQLVKKGPRQEKIAVARGQVKQAQAALNSAKTQLNKTTIESPIKGVIAQKKIELGEMATTGNPVAKIVQMNPIEFEGSISTTDLTKVDIGQQVTVEVDSYPGKTFTGEISRVAPTINSSNRGLKVTVQIANDDLLLKPGMFTTGNILVDELENVLVVPKAAIREEDGDKRILIVKNGIIEIRKIEIGPSNNDHVVIDQGLKPGDKVVVRGPANLQPGTEVKATEWGDA
ncbi:efflux RND transporter periplasmic adaptor subunit [Selenihalanaerobacter shriftii]|uniref:RND family efflux transporter, MFP subunit n=1 Tax=Selenihalanaerobacter shriftii TaxID=142842 RepID=A0A1T4JJE6_9FIRM|nr:efflux RND transporter periplasmic adaptor subunit [Selenihalanaerobacter shriftii]SJZ30248.1 RND family efflux transporter, MFP subunit [Selenihalanaerobacter shriftii]